MGNIGWDMLGGLKWGWRTNWRRRLRPWMASTRSWFLSSKTSCPRLLPVGLAEFHLVDINVGQLPVGATCIYSWFLLANYLGPLLQLKQFYERRADEAVHCLYPMWCSDQQLARAFQDWGFMLTYSNMCTACHISHDAYIAFVDWQSWRSVKASKAKSEASKPPKASLSAKKKLKGAAGTETVDPVVPPPNGKKKKRKGSAASASAAHTVSKKKRRTK